MFRWLSLRRRARIRQQPFPAAWSAIIEKNVPYVAQLPAADRDELIGHVKVFVAEKNFEGCGGLEIDDEVKLTIAAQACVLLLHRDHRLLPAADVDPRLPASTYFAPPKVGARRMGW